MKSKLINFLPAVFLSLVSFILLIMPGSDIPKSSLFDILYFDKWVHVGMFGLLTIVWGYPFLKKYKRSAKVFCKISVIIIVYGVAMEFAQKYLAVGRSFDILDILADCVGSVIACYWLISRLKKTNLVSYKK